MSQPVEEQGLSPLEDPCTFQWRNPRLMTAEECEETERTWGIAVPRPGAERDWVITECQRRRRAGIKFRASDITLEYRRRFGKPSSKA